MEFDLTDADTLQPDRMDHASIAFDLVPEARQTYPSEDDALSQDRRAP
jgi:hypothetical protein